MSKDLALTNYNYENGRYNLARVDVAGGDVSFDETQAYPVMTSVVCKRRGYWADLTHGSELFQLRSLTQRTPSQAEAMTLDAIAPLQQRNLIAAGATAAAKAAGGNALDVDLTWTTPGGSGGNASFQA